MRYLAYFFLLALSGLTVGQETPMNFFLSGTSIVALYTPDWEITTDERDAEGFYDMLDDYRHYAGELQERLRGNNDVVFHASFARRVTFRDSGIPAVSREALSGYGFIIYVPGKAPKVYQGVATDVDVLCSLKELDNTISVDVSCASKAGR